MAQSLFLSCAICLLLSFMLPGCGGSDKDKVKSTGKLHPEVQRSLDNFNEHHRTKKYMLLSLKYDEEFKRVKGALDDYEAGMKNIEDKVGFLGVKNEDASNKDINIYDANLSLLKRLSTEHKISEAKLARIIVDYNIMTDWEMCAER